MLKDLKYLEEGVLKIPLTTFLYFPRGEETIEGHDWVENDSKNTAELRKHEIRFIYMICIIFFSSILKISLF